MHSGGGAHGDGTAPPRLDNRADLLQRAAFIAEQKPEIAMAPAPRAQRSSPGRSSWLRCTSSPAEGPLR